MVSIHVFIVLLLLYYRKITNHEHNINKPLRQTGTLTHNACMYISNLLFISFTDIK